METTSTLKPQTNPTEILDGRRLVVARVSWIVFAATLTLLQILSQIAMLQQLPNSDLAPSQFAALQAMGLSVQTYNFLRFLWEAPLALAWGGLGLLIFLRKSKAVWLDVFAAIDSTLDRGFYFALPAV